MIRRIPNTRSDRGREILRAIKIAAADPARAMATVRGIVRIHARCRTAPAAASSSCPRPRTAASMGSMTPRMSPIA